ncbi:MAG: VOC family protein [Acetanaerobacterium sp.]
MRIDHIAVYTDDLPQLKRFYERYFGAAANDGYHNPRTGLQTYFLTFEDGARLEIMTRPGLAPKPATTPCAGYTHIAFSVGTREAVDDLTARLRQDGYCVASEPRVTGDGYYESVVLDPECNLIEITE